MSGPANKISDGEDGTEGSRSLINLQNAHNEGEKHGSWSVAQISPIVLLNSSGTSLQRLQIISVVPLRSQAILSEQNSFIGISVILLLEATP